MPDGITKILTVIQSLCTTTFSLFVHVLGTSRTHQVTPRLARKRTHSVTVKEKF